MVWIFFNSKILSKTKLFSKP